MNNMNGWKDFLNEDAISPSELPENTRISVKFKEKDSAMVVLTDKYFNTFDHKKGAPIYGQMWLSWYPECGGYMIQWVKVTKGWGPLFYDIAMELAAQHNSWIVGDRSSVTPEAEKIWQYYDQHRGDVESEPISLESDCGFRSAIKFTKYHQEEAEKRGVRPLYDDWEKHPLARRWRKPDASTISALKSQGQFFDVDKIYESGKKLDEEMMAKFHKKYEQVYFELPITEDEFVHFTPAQRAQEIIKVGALLMRPPHKKFGIDAVTAVSLTYGQNVPGVQTTHLPEDEGQIVAIKFKTNVLPQIGHVEEVIWKEDVTLIDPQIITKAKAQKLLHNTPENKRLNKLDWGFVQYARG